MKFSIKSFIWTVVLVAALVVGFMAFRPKPVSVETALVSQGDLQITVREDGKTRIRDKYTVSTPVAGRLSRIELEPGDEVCGDVRPFAVILPAKPSMLDARAKAQAEARVEQAAASVKRAQAAAKQLEAKGELAKNKLARVKKLIESKSISRDEYDVARTEYLSLSQSIRAAGFDQEIAKYELKTAKAAVLQFSDDQSHSGQPFEVFTPVCGNVLRVFQESATAVNVGTPLIEIGDPANLEMVIDVLSTDAVKIRPGSKLVVRHWGGEQPLAGTVRVVEPAAFTKVSSLGVEEQRVNVIADFDAEQEGVLSLGDGFRVEADITVKHLPNALQVPNSSLFRYQREWHVFVVEADRSVRRKVAIGDQNDMYTEIRAGLKAGEAVILFPSDSVTNEGRVRVSESNALQ